MKIALWLTAIIVSGAMGFYFGVGYGAQSLGAIVAQNEVMDGLKRVRLTLNALEKNELAHSNEMLKLNLKSALSQIDSYSKSLAYWECTGEDRETIQAAQRFALGNPSLLNGTMQQFELQGFEFCTAKVGS